MLFFNSYQKKILVANIVFITVLTIALNYLAASLRTNQTMLSEQLNAVSQLTNTNNFKNEFNRVQNGAIELAATQQDASKKKMSQANENLVVLLKKEPNFIKGGQDAYFSFYSDINQATAHFINDEKLKGTLFLQKSIQAASVLSDDLEQKFEISQNKVINLSQQVNATSSQIIIFMYWLIAATIVLGVGASYVIAKVLGTPIASIQRTVQCIEKENDLSVRSDVDSNDEAGRLALTFNQLMTQFSTIVSDVKLNAEQVAGASNQLTSITAQTSRGAEEQSNSIIQIATAMTQMEATVSDVARNAEEASKAANSGDVEAREGKIIIENTIKAIEKTANDIKDSSEVIIGLQSESDKIAKVLEVINSIAEQTNLLALNAAIEAARAGEQGRGFAVVADEVRALAQRTQEATSDIESSVASLQKGTNNAVSVMSANQSKVEETIEQSQKAGEALNSIAKAVSNIQLMNTQIATAAEEQHATTEEINRNINEIQSVSSQTAEGAKEVQTAATQLNALGEELHASVSIFKT